MQDGTEESLRSLLKQVQQAQKHQNLCVEDQAALRAAHAMIRSLSKSPGGPGVRKREKSDLNGKKQDINNEQSHRVLHSNSLHHISSPSKHVNSWTKTRGKRSQGQHLVKLANELELVAEVLSKRKHGTPQPRETNTTRRLSLKNANTQKCLKSDESRTFQEKPSCCIQIGHADLDYLMEKRADADEFLTSQIRARRRCLPTKSAASEPDLAQTSFWDAWASLTFGNLTPDGNLEESSEDEGEDKDASKLASQSGRGKQIVNLDPLRDVDEAESWIMTGQDHQRDFVSTMDSVLALLARGEDFLQKRKPERPSSITSDTSSRSSTFV
mmetsp:Transcript_21975/g.43197  ORF Transcript_21975/g.43197 Transcript_21975/m.43197 type:complete len:327 (-) Transcript_21975:335-1315(-)